METIHKLPMDPLELFEEVNKESVKVKVKYRTVQIIVEKVISGYCWKRLGRDQWKWIERLLDVDEDDSNNEEESADMRGDRVVNPLPEALFEEDEDEEEDGEITSETSSEYSIDDEVDEESKSVESDDIDTTEDKIDKLDFVTDSTTL